MADFYPEPDMPVTLLSIVIPVYKSAETLEELFAQIRATLEKRVPFEVIFVDDGSNDGSWAKLEQIKKANPSLVKAVKFNRNYGQHNAIACGFGFAKGQVIVTMDDDLQHPPSEIIKLLDKYEETGADLVYGQYISKQHAKWRNAGSTVLQSGSESGGTSFRLLIKPIAEKVTAHLQHGFLFIDEVIRWYTNQIAFVEVEHHPRRSGKSTYTGGKLVRMYFDILINYSAVPLKVMTWIGLISSFLTFLLGVRFIYNKLVHGSTPGFTAIIVTVLFSTSILMLCMGIVGQYMHKLYRLQNRRPSYSIEKAI